MGKDGKGWKGKGKPPLRSEGERQHARAVNAARAAEGLPNKSTGSVSRSKARALAHREKSQAVPADSIGEPAVLPPAPPKAPPRERVFLTAGLVQLQWDDPMAETGEAQICKPSGRG